MLDAFFQRVWYERRSRWLSLSLLPLSRLFGGLAALRRVMYRVGLLESQRVNRPVVVIGNITVGGVGKTPLTIWLAQRLAARGVRVGIVLRGYGGRASVWPQDVTSDSHASEVGDEAVLLAVSTGAVVAAGPDRVAAARRVIERGAEIVLSDDGLQHYRLARDAEIIVLDAERMLGNGRLLPAGPLREPPRRLEAADLVILTVRPGAAAPASCASDSRTRAIAHARLADAVSLCTGEKRPLQAFRATPVHALAAVGNPDPFFRALRAAGLTVRTHRFADHASLNASDVRFGDDAPVLMTEKDAVKCRPFADARMWAVPMEIEMSEAGASAIDALASRLLGRPLETGE